MAEYNKDAVRLVKPYVDAGDNAVATVLGKLFKGAYATAPSAADYVGQLYLNTATATAGLYIATGTTTPGWTKIVISE